MIMINGNWEQVKELSDIIKIVNENIGYEFAQKVEEIFSESSIKILKDKNFMLQSKVENVEYRLNEARKIFVELLEITNNTLADKYLEDFDNIISGERRK